MVIEQSARSDRMALPIEASATSSIGPHWRKRAASCASSIRLETPGYIAMAAFLLAYLLNVLGGAPTIQAVLNLVGAVIGAIYLRRKHALPSVISNVTWAGITIVGLVLGR